MIGALDKHLMAVKIAKDTSLSLVARTLAVVLLDHYNCESGRCDPGREPLAAEIGVSERTVGRALDCLVRAGYFKRHRRGFPRTNSYEPVFAANGDRTPVADQLGGDRTPVADHTESDRPNSVKVTGHQCPIETKKETREGRGGEPPHHTIINGGLKQPAAKKWKRAPELYLARHGCTIDSYQPDPQTMGAWAAENVPLVRDPVAPATVDGIKDVWRQRGEQPKDLDATYRTYLRKRQEWTERDAAKAKPNGSGASFTQSRAAI